MNRNKETPAAPPISMWFILKILSIPDTRLLKEKSASRPVSRILSGRRRRNAQPEPPRPVPSPCAVIPLGRKSPSGSSNLPGDCENARTRFAVSPPSKGRRFADAARGFREAGRLSPSIWSCSGWGLPGANVAAAPVRSCRTFSPLPDPAARARLPSRSRRRRPAQARTPQTSHRRCVFCCTFRRVAPPSR